MRKYIISIQHEQIEVDINGLKHLIKDDWTIFASFTNESFIKLNDGTLIRMYNKDLKDLQSEIRNITIEQIIK